MEIKRVTLEEVRQKALPILVAGYEKRKKLRSSAEERLREQGKVIRDKQTSGRPKHSSI